MFAALLILTFFGSMPSVNGGVAPVQKSLEARYRHARTLKAEFFQRYSDGSGGVSAESGVVYFSRPGRMRWEYESRNKSSFSLMARTRGSTSPPITQLAAPRSGKAPIGVRRWRCLPPKPICLSSAAKLNSLAIPHPSRIRTQAAAGDAVRVACPEVPKKELRLRTCCWKWTVMVGLHGL